MSILTRALFVLLVSACLPTAAIAVSDNVDIARQREQFPLVWEAAKHAPEGAWRRLASGLETYPLYPYLELASLQRQMPQLNAAQVEKFVATWPNSLPARTLRDAFLIELARRRDWKNFLALNNDPSPSRELQCDALQARLALSHPLDFKKDVSALWLSPTALPGACDVVQQWARDHGKLTPALVWERIELAARANHAEVINALADLLDPAERDSAKHAALAISDPPEALQQAEHWVDTAHERASVTNALERLARKNSELAQTQWALFEHRFAFDTEQRGRVLRALALYRATSYAPEALARLDALPNELTDDTTREWRVRMALAVQDWKDASKALEIMPPAQRDDPRWRYVLARVLVKLGEQDKATALLGALSRETNFHGFLAADWLQAPYTICAVAGPDDTTQVRKLPGLVRAFEFFALNDLPEARREWDFVLPSLDPAHRRSAAAAATEIGWYDRAVYTFSQGEDLHLYELRFPLVRQAQIVRAAHDAGIDPAWAYAIIRAESAWTSDAHSGADAYGLMQLLPGTAAQLAHALKVPYGGTRDLFNADTNITLGTRYLGNMALRYDGSPWLATAAYNAGVDPVGRWVDARDTLEPDFFIETIPYKETREYVSRVLAFSVIYDWRMHGNAQPLSSRLPRIGQAYTTPSADAPRKAVVCAAAPEKAVATNVPLEQKLR